MADIKPDGVSESTEETTEEGGQVESDNTDDTGAANSGDGGAVGEGNSGVGEGDNESPDSDGGDSEDAKDPKYTDDDLDHHKGEARKSARSKVLKDLGFDSLEAAKRFVTDARTEGEEGKTAKDEASQVLAIANKRIVRADAKTLAAEVGIRPERVGAVIDLADLTEVTVSEDGEADVKTIKAALSNVLTKYPEFGKPDVGNAPGNRNRAEGGVPTGIDAQIQAAADNGDYITAERLRAQKLQQEGKFKIGA